jgi:hypothetical protein
MSRRPHHIPSQRLPLSVSTIQAKDSAKPRRSMWWAAGIAIGGWALLAYPAVLLVLLSWILVTGSGIDGSTGGSTAAGVLGLAFVVCMAAAPVLFGLAVARRLRGLWIGAIATGVLSLAAVVYVIVEWVVPLG